MTEVPASDSPRRIVFDGKDLRVVVQPAHSQEVVVSFNWGKYVAEGDHFYADDLFQKLKLSAVGIVSKRPHWYCCEEWPQALAAAIEAMRGYRLRVGYGFSMGGYAVLKYSKALGLDRVLCFSPQWSVDPEEAPWDARKDWAFVPFMRGMGVRPPDRAGLAYLFVDPCHSPDWEHAQKVLQAGDNVLIPMRYCEHDTIKMLLGRESMGEILKVCMHGKPEEAKAVVRQRKRASKRFSAHIFSKRGLRRLEADDIVAALRWWRVGDHFYVDAAPVAKLRKLLVEKGLLPAKSPLAAPPT
ncbi:hypothetical protein [Ideonella dechloratans]|uniref:hypothetical protein n=1 Tax=Ideonella dechloratans TaxID=36863 RepID=UPI0035B0188A